ncbi:MAG: hypothetical protein CBB68_02875 [Rhodospirillaceae bacterium TMED8]|nr:MAG: hypothetical protein CBB68_02875 [Rhodospirillaceae bacterium TMED8]
MSPNLDSNSFFQPFSLVVQQGKLGGLLIAILCAVLASFHLWTAAMGTLYPFSQRAFPMMVCAAIIFLGIRASSKNSSSALDTDCDKNIPVYDWILVLLTLPAFGWIAFQPDYLANRWPLTLSDAPTVLEQTLGWLAILLLFEATRRTTGWVLVIGGALVLLYAYVGEHIKISGLSHRGFESTHIIDYMFMTLDGIWGVAIGVAATYIVVFIIFGAFMEKAGAADFFVDLVTAIAGHTRGGPGKVGIFSSALVGSVTGSSVANVYTTGQFTIPMMKRLGYAPKTAGAIEALASNGGQLMPPVMGAAAFIVAAYAGVPYSSILLASVLPAALYFLSLFIFVHLTSVKTGMAGMPLEEKPKLIDVLRQRGHLLIPMVGLIALLIWGVSPLRAAFYAVCSCVVVSWLRPETRLTPLRIWAALRLGAQNSLMILSTCAIVGLIIGTFTLTGLALNASSIIINLSGGINVLVLFCVVIASIVLGMGMNTVAAFMLVSILGVPALLEIGMDNVTAHMFVFYAALLSHITPPVCLAVFAAAQIAGANIWATSVQAMKMGLIAYLMPFLIAGSPSLLLGIGSKFSLIPVISAFIGSICAACAVEGWTLKRLKPFPRVLLGAGAVLLILPMSNGRLIGCALVIAGLFFSSIRSSKSVKNA